MGRIIRSAVLTALITALLLLLFAAAVPSAPITDDARQLWLEDTDSGEYDFL